MTGNSINNSKYILLFLFFMSLVGGLTLKAQDFFTKADNFFKTYVHEGLVDYADIKENQGLLNELVEHLARSPYQQMTYEQRKVYLINAYNLFVIDGVLQHFPIYSPMEVSGFFEKEKHLLNGKEYDLNAIENDILRKDYTDSRLHFVLVCGAMSCPPIISEAYKAEIIEQQLTQQTQLALNNPDFIRINREDKKIEISEIFSWYKSDFLLKAKSIREYINQYRIIPLPEEYKISFYIYDWSLNNLVQSQQPSFEKGIQDNPNSFLQTYTPSSLLGKGHWEFSIFNNLYTQTRAADENGNISKVDRENYFTSSIKAIYGVSKQKRFNVGIILNVKSTAISTNTLAPFAFENNDTSKRSGLGSIAPLLKFTPFNNIGNFSIQTSLSIPLETQSESPVFLDKNSYVWSNQLFYDFSFAQNKFQIFTELDVNYIFGDKDLGYANNSIQIPASVFLSYFPNSISTLYSMIQHSPTYGIGNSGFDQEFTQFGLGGKYQLSDNMNIEILITDFFRGENSGVGETYNLGLKYLL